MQASTISHKPQTVGNIDLSDLQWETWDKQTEALERISDPETECLLYGGARGGGKTHLARLYGLLRACKYEGHKVLICRRSFPELERNIIVPMRQTWPWLIYQERHHRFLIPESDSIIELGYTEGDYHRFQGASIDTLIIDEAGQITKDVYQFLRSCLRTTNPLVKPKTLLTANPGGPGHHWLKKLFIDREPEPGEDVDQFQYLQALVWDNPSLVDSDPDYVKRLEAMPEAQRQAYLMGDWTALLGSFFVPPPPQTDCEPFTIEESSCEQYLFGSLDSGIRHPTSFGLLFWDKGRIYRLFSYLNSGGTIAGHAEEIRSRIEAFPWTHGQFPVTIWADSSMWTEARLNERMIRSQIDEYKDAFQGTRTRFEKATRDKTFSCMITQQMFSGRESYPEYVLWKGTNHGWRESITLPEIDQNHPESYLKCDGDDVADETRYGCMGLWAWQNRLKQGNVLQQKARAKMNKLKEKDWYAL